jgi:ATP-binding cassette subfamily A (ABC1) protein 3
VNGAGKTTTFKMLTGDEGPSNGNAYAFMHNLKGHRKSFLRNIGYCPQFDGIVGVLTGREMLELFSRLRGVPSKQIPGQVNKWLGKLGLLKAGDVKCENYSGGMKRRLSVGMAMIGDPPVVLLDERKPTFVHDALILNRNIINL